MPKNFEIQKVDGEGAIRFLNSARVDVASFDVKIVTIGFYSDEDEFFYDVMTSELGVKTRLNGDTLYYTYEGMVAVEIPESDLDKFLAEDFLDVSCDFLMNGSYLEEEEEIEIAQPSPWIKLSLIK